MIKQIKIPKKFLQNSSIFNQGDIKNLAMEFLKSNYDLPKTFPFGPFYKLPLFSVKGLFNTEELLSEASRMVSNTVFAFDLKKKGNK